MAPSGDADIPILTAVSGSARQLFLLLRCISFSPKAHVQILEQGLMFTTEEARVMQGHTFLDKKIFTSFSYSPNGTDPPPFQISLSSLLETLQIFGINDIKDRSSSNRDPSFTSLGSSFRSGAGGSISNDLAPHALGMTGMCRLSYQSPGSPLEIHLSEPNISTTCSLTTYEPEPHQTEIPLRRDAISMKIIMRASWLYDAITELSSTSPTRLIITASSTAPFFALSAAGPLGSASVEFSKDPQLLETFYVSPATATSSPAAAGGGRFVNTYKYEMVRGASRAMAIATKVSIRGDEQGVLSLQFMIENNVESDAGSRGGVNFVDFTFVPFLPEEGEGDQEEEDEEDEGRENDGEDALE